MLKNVLVGCHNMCSQVFDLNFCNLVVLVMLLAQKCLQFLVMIGGGD